MARSAPDDRATYTSLAATARAEHSDVARDYDPPQPKRTSWRRLETIHLLILSFGSLILLLALIALGLLWRESIRAAGGAKPRMPWVGLLSRNWATSFVTVCTAIIRTSITFQAGLATAMFAGIILEKVGVPLAQGPFYSIIRASDAIPATLLSMTIFRSKGVLSRFICAMVVVEVLVTVASQFLSTILVSDFREATFADMDNATEVRTFDNAIGLTGEKWWSVPAAVTWGFAERSEPGPEGAAFRDTGPTYRAFLPFEAEAQRTRIQSFDGPALVMDQRVVCVKPTLLDIEFGSYGESGTDYLEGELALEPGSHPEQGDEGTPLSFTCGLGQGSSPDTTGIAAGDYKRPNSTGTGQTGLCILRDTMDDLPLNGPLIDHTLREKYPIAAPTNTFVVLDISSRDAFNGTAKVDPDRNDGPWTIVTGKSDEEALRVTACFSNLNSLTFGVRMSGSPAPVESGIPWDSEGYRYDTRAVRRQLGASSSPESLDGRGILTLEPESEWRHGTALDSLDGYPVFFSESLVHSVSQPGTEELLHLSVMLSPDSQDQYRAHATHAAVFQDTLHETDNPALAVQAALARIHQMAYYTELPRRTAKEVATTSFLTSALIPVRWIGFIVATGLVGVHFVITFVVAVLFLGYTRHSLIGNHWQAVSQVVSEETLPILKQADRMNDNDLWRWAVSQSVDVTSHAILRRRSDGRTAVCTAGCRGDMEVKMGPLPVTVDGSVVRANEGVGEQGGQLLVSRTSQGL